MTARTLIVFLAAAAVVGACASGGTGTGARSSRDVITSEEITSASMGAFSAYEVVERLRARWLRPPGSGAFLGAERAPRVYVNNVHFGDIEQLRSVPAGDVESIRYLNESDATMRWGTGHPAGAILVLTKTGGQQP